MEDGKIVYEKMSYSSCIAYGTTLPSLFFAEETIYEMEYPVWYPNGHIYIANRKPRYTPPEK